MRTIVKGKNIEVSERVRQYAERKLERIERLLDDRTDALLELSVEQHRSMSDSHIAEVTLVIDGQTLRSHAAGPTHRTAIDTVADKVERRAVDHKEKPHTARATEGRQSVRRTPVETTGSRDRTAEAGSERRVVKMKRFAIEPMFEEDAVAEMEELGHSFFIFVNAEDERLNILYRRLDGQYGVIEPMIAGEYSPGAGRQRRAARPRPA